MVKSEVKNDWRESRRQSARDAIVDAAWALVREEGLAALSLRDLAQRAGITTPTVYSYFESKHAIYDAMFGQAATAFAARVAARDESGDDQAALEAGARLFVEFCTEDVPRYQLLFQHTIPGFAPSPASYAPAVRALNDTRAALARHGFTEPRHLDMWTARMSGLVDQQISNDPGGDRWIRLIDDFAAMFVDHCRSQAPTRTRQPAKSRTKGTKR